MEYKNILKGDTEEFSKKIKESFGISIDQIPPEILSRGKDTVAFYLSSFFSSSISDTMEKTALAYWQECNIELKE